MPARTKLAQVVGRREGFGRPNKIPTLRHNPGDLRHSPHSSHQGIDPDAIGIIATDEEGWEDLERQLGLYAERGLTIREMVETYAPANENDTEAYLEFVCAYVPCEPLDAVSKVLEIPAEVS